MEEISQMLGLNEGIEKSCWLNWYLRNIYDIRSSIKKANK